MTPQEWSDKKRQQRDARGKWVLELRNSAVGGSWFVNHEFYALNIHKAMDIVKQTINPIILPPDWRVKCATSK